MSGLRSPGPPRAPPAGRASLDERSRVFRLLTILGVLLIALGALWNAVHDPLAELDAFASPLVRLERHPRPAIGPGIETWVFDAASGERDSALWRPSPIPSDTCWTLVMLGGLGTGARGGLLIPEELPVNVLALEWHWEGPRAPRGMQFVEHAFGFRRLVLSAPAALARTVDAAARAREVDTTRIAILGVSLGVPPSVAALHYTRQADAVVLLHGGASLDVLMARSLDREHVPKWLARIGGRIGASFIAPIEPALQSARTREMPALLLSSRTDEIIPREAAERLHALFPRGTSRWGEGPHIRKFRTALIDSLSRELVTWLDAGPGRRAAP